jgi:rhodanese-related sulfurtransferase
MNKYLLLGLSVLVIALIGSIVYIQSMENQNTNVLGAVSVFSDISPEQFNQALSTGKYTLIDVRTVEEYSAGHLAKAEESDFYQTQQFSNFLDSLDKNGKYLVYCRTGIRSGKTLQIMQQKGFTTVYDLAGGYNAWVATGLPVKK